MPPLSVRTRPLEPCPAAPCHTVAAACTRDVLQPGCTGPLARAVRAARCADWQADSLADRVAVMASGRLRAVGTPFELKAQLGAGYRLSLVLPPHLGPATLLRELRGMLPGAQVCGDHAMRAPAQLQARLAFRHPCSASRQCPAGVHVYWWDVRIPDGT